ncbi:hypothetical protein SB49_00180 [Sediminicola sp. YIK13]|uniref:hypothetical protein n=1 Tax=Sediminicola sp. YIK13 TaxID=1453352 RepID=UPI00071FA3E4|nr:hypothetical protein [Sediminicola sp. YIK13]ALM06404.1 hypothetical protein SB49_00180 [Sediminicola sp. YIK13]
MNIKLLLVAVIFILTTACHNKKNDAEAGLESKKSANQFDLPDSLSTRRISFALQLKKSVAESTWFDFGTKNNEGTLIYFDADRAEVFFPDSNVVRKLRNSKKHSDNYWLTERMDSIPYHMEVMISFNEEDSLEYYFKNPVEQYSSVEEIGKYIPSVESTEMWATMVVHEMFHHYQYNNKNYRKYADSQIAILPFDSRNLVALCQEDKQFLSMIRSENDILMKAISNDIEDDRDALITSYLDQREKRIAKYGAEYPHLEQVENYYVIQEGSARYIEYQSMFTLKSYFNNPDAPTTQDDPKFSSYSEFEEINLENDAFNYLVYAGTTDYHYTIGFNIMRLLDKLKIEYKKDLLNNPEKGLHQYLEDYTNTLPNKT